MVRCWQPTPAGRHRLSVLGALNAVTHQLLTVTTDAYINSQHVCRMPHQLAALGLTVPITVVLDNARYPRCGLVQQTTAHLNIKLLFLPAYSPQFNLIERFWRLVKKCRLHARYYPTFPVASYLKGSAPRISSMRSQTEATFSGGYHEQATPELER